MKKCEQIHTGIPYDWHVCILKINSTPFGLLTHTDTYTHMHLKWLSMHSSKWIVIGGQDSALGKAMGLAIVTGFKMINDQQIFIISHGGTHRRSSWGPFVVDVRIEPDNSRSTVLCFTKCAILALTMTGGYLERPWVSPCVDLLIIDHESMTPHENLSQESVLFSVSACAWYGSVDQWILINYAM
jgi:hypothetical protein